MPPATALPADLDVRPGFAGLVAFAELIDEPLEPFEKKIARAHFGPEREVAAVLPRGNKKTTLAAKIGLHHLLTVDGAAVTIGAASKDQARICFERMKGFAQHPALDESVVIRHLELRHDDEDGHQRLLRVVPSEGSRVHGLSSTLYIGDELWAWPDEALLEAMQTGLVKNPGSRLLVISTPAAQLDSALGRLRARALAGKTNRRGALLDATAPGLRWLEWSVPEDRELNDFKAVKMANPAGYITIASLREQAERVPEPAFAQFHAARWGIGEGQWLPPNAWSACAAEYEIEPGEEIVAAVDIGGERSASVVLWLTPDLRLGVRIWQGNAAVLEIVDFLRELCGTYRCREISYDPWGFRSEALRLEQEGMPVVEFRQTHARMGPATSGARGAITDKRIKHPDDPELNSHIARAIVKQTSRGSVLTKASETDQIDGAVCLAMAVERVSEPAPTTKILGWL